MSIFIPLIFLAVGAACHKRGKELIALADKHQQGGEKAEG